MTGLRESLTIRTVRKFLESNLSMGVNPGVAGRRSDRDSRDAV